MINIVDYKDLDRKNLFMRKEEELNITDVVKDIIYSVKMGGDKTLKKYCELFDGKAPENLEVTAAEMEAAFNRVDSSLIKTMEKAAANIREFHSKQLREGFKIEKAGGVVMGQKVTPIEKVGIYIPGGTASYPSTVLMNCIPAKIAGCREIVMVSPPACDGDISPVILAAVKIAGVDRVFRAGGAQGIAALAYGTETIPKVYKITGPGNAYVAEAKRQVFGIVDIDTIAGPSEVLVIADKNTNPAYAAADMLSQAEHDRLASAVMITDSRELAEKVAGEIEKQLESLPRKEIAEASIRNNGRIIIAENLDMAVELANELAPEHLEIDVDNPFDYLDRIENAGSVFLGRNCPEALGDYVAGPNHTLPTGGRAKFSSPLSVDDFIKKIQFSYFEKSALEELKDDICTFAQAEGLEGHGRSIKVRFE